MEEKKDNLEIWNRLKIPPSNAIKPILAGRLKGKSDLNPQWRYEAITEVFGICGIGWKYTIDKLWTEAGSDDQVMCFAIVSFYYNRNEVFGDPEKLPSSAWSDPIPGIGGSMMVTKETAGLHSSDEGYKMAVTDALSVALKMIGVGADVYRGIMESKYSKEPIKEPQSKASSEKTTGELKITKVILKEDVGKDGKPYKKYTIIDNNDNKYTTFSNTFAGIAKEARDKGLAVEIESEKGRFGLDLISIEKVSSNETPPPGRLSLEDEKNQILDLLRSLATEPEHVDAMCIEGIGKKAEDEWTAEDVDKMREYIGVFEKTKEAA